MINRFRNKNINFKVTEEQKEQIIYKMKKSKIDNFNDFSHKCIFTNKLYIIDFKTIDEVIKYLASIENNISKLINISEKNKNKKQTIILKLQKTKIKKIKTFILNKIFTATIIEIDLDLKKDKEKRYRELPLIKDVLNALLQLDYNNKEIDFFK